MTLAVIKQSRSIIVSNLALVMDLTNGTNHARLNSFTRPEQLDERRILDELIRWQDAYVSEQGGVFIAVQSRDLMVAHNRPDPDSAEVYQDLVRSNTITFSSYLPPKRDFLTKQNSVC